MERPAPTLNVRMLEEYFFCPMIIHYKYILGINKPPGLWSHVGIKIQEELAEYVEKNYKILGKQVYLESRKHGLTGRVDYIVEHRGRPAPLEIKYSRKLRPWWKYTLIAYAILIEENTGKPVKTAILVTPGPRSREINITISDRQYVEETIETIKQILDNKKQAKPKPSKTCKNCDYKDICPYKTTR